MKTIYEKMVDVYTISHAIFTLVVAGLTALAILTIIFFANLNWR